MFRDAWVEIDKSKLAHNFMEVRRAVGDDVKICAVLKAQCYGVDGVQAGMVFDGLGADSFAVAVLSEAMELREVIPEKEILILGYVSPAGYDIAIENRITLPMYREDALLALNERAGELGKKALVHIKINSGMNRLGFLPTEESADIIAHCMKLPNIDVTGIFTH
ncbi:MAG: alanine racemase, partial [Oscillospiraceae bacterium]|nr:alanine racemase [Oscillospiraceae bacterium]